MTTPEETYPVRERNERPVPLRGLIEVVQALALAVVISVVLNLFVVQVTEVRQRSMEPTLLQSDRVLVSKIDYRITTPAACDIIVFDPPAESDIPYVKRVVAVAGERIELRGGQVLVDGAPRDCAEAIGTTQPQSPAMTYPFVVPQGEVWVMGDNRQASSDSRSFGTVPVTNIIGKVLVRFWPLDRAHFFAW